jgi:hypothetical protein
MHGMPTEPVQIESSYNKSTAAGFLKPYKILLLTYDGQKPPSPAFHTALATWVRSGGALIVVDDDKDPYNQATDWWNSGGLHFANPRQQLFQMLDIAPDAAGLHPVGKGFVLYEPQSPSALTYNRAGSAQLLTLLHTAAGAIHLPLQETHPLVLRRGPYVIAAGLDADPMDVSSSTEPPVVVTGDLINLFDPDLAESDHVIIKPGTRALLLDVNSLNSSTPRLVAASAKISHEQVSADSLTFQAEGIDQTQAVARILLKKAVRQVTLNGKPLDSSQYQRNGRTLLLHFQNTAAPQQIKVLF